VQGSISNIRFSPLVNLGPDRRARERRGRFFRKFLWLLLLGGLGYAVLHYFREWRSSHRYDAIIVEAANRHHVSPALVKAIICQESGFRPWSEGKAEEVGLMQLTPGAVRDWERSTGQKCQTRGALFDPRLNIEIGSWYIASNLAQWQAHPDMEVLALAQYNAGIRNAMKWAATDAAASTLDRISFPGTRRYIERILRSKQKYEHDLRDTR